MYQAYKVFRHPVVCGLKNAPFHHAIIMARHHAIIISCTAMRTRLLRIARTY